MMALEHGARDPGDTQGTASFRTRGWFLSALLISLQALVAIGTAFLGHRLGRGPLETLRNGCRQLARPDRVLEQGIPADFAGYLGPERLARDHNCLRRTPIPQECRRWVACAVAVRDEPWRLP